MSMRSRPIAYAAMTMAITGALALITACNQGGQGSGESTGATSTQQGAAASGSAAAPQAFAVCSSCHAVVPGQNRIGPSLAGVWGRKAASGSGYNYSPALKNAGIVWDDASLDRWLQGPVKMVPGSKMVIGISDPQGRKSVIEYLKTLK